MTAISSQLVQDCFWQTIYLNTFCQNIKLYFESNAKLIPFFADPNASSGTAMAWHWMMEWVDKPLLQQWLQGPLILPARNTDG